MVDQFPPQAPMPGMPQMPPPGGMIQQQQTTTNEELIEAIIEEKWSDLVKDISKIVEWKAVTENKLTKMEQQITDMKDSFDQLHQGILNKVGEYDKHILDVGTELKAMEKVFEKVLPLFTENVAALTHVADDFRSMLGVPDKKPVAQAQVEEKKPEEKEDDRPY